LFESAIGEFVSVPLFVAQERMGHKDIQTTLRYYAHATKSKKLLATGAIIRFLGQGEDNQLELSISATR